MKQKMRKKRRTNIMKVVEVYIGQIVKARFDTVNRF